MELVPISPLGEILITDLDLPQPDPNYFTVMSEQDYQEHFGESGLILYGEHVAGAYPRTFATLPLEIDEDGNCIPIPFIVDTGAPGNLFLGLGATKMLRRWGIFVGREVSERFDVRSGSYEPYLKGKLRYINDNVNKYINKPIVNDLPEKFLRHKDGSDNIIWMDLRANIIGLQMLINLNITLDFSRIFRSVEEDDDIVL